MSDIFSFLTEHAIPFQRFDHVAVFTCEESAKLPPMPGGDTKNLFLRDDKGKRHFLVTVGHEKTVDLKKLKDVLGVKGVSFASPERLKQYLSVDPGSVTLLGLIHDRDRAVEVWIDEAVWSHEFIQCHPLVNTATLVIPREGMEKFFEITKHQPHIADIPSRV
ncbi:prolyl-tRNA synthetase associated domain-containing protein [Candidatus Peregrinibacteria bacterium]|nr:prolyl-tRNA synthetase associated domain-containing protein [Candidatus Peregrinibacteria bacterium]